MGRAASKYISVPYKWRPPRVVVVVVDARLPARKQGARRLRLQHRHLRLLLALRSARIRSKRTRIAVLTYPTYPNVAASLHRSRHHTRHHRRKHEEYPVMPCAGHSGSLL